MSGHSKWSTIKRQKGINDARRGQLFTKLARELAVAARQGGSDPEINFRLRLAIQKARENNMPMNNVERAMKRGSGEGDQSSMDSVTYEGYSPGGAAILLEALTDNPTRTVSEVRHIFNKAGGNLGEPGCVAWNFEPRGILRIETSEENAEEMTLLAIDAGASDFELDGSHLEIRTSPNMFEQVRRVLENTKSNISRSELEMLPKNIVSLEDKEAMQTLRLLDKLDELDDVQHVYTNADFPDVTLKNYQTA